MKTVLIDYFTTKTTSEESEGDVREFQNWRKTMLHVL